MVSPATIDEIRSESQVAPVEVESRCLYGATMTQKVIGQVVNSKDNSAMMELIEIGCNCPGQDRDENA
jgi:hypothetical protein